MRKREGIETRIWENNLEGNLNYLRLQKKKKINLRNGSTTFRSSSSYYHCTYTIPMLPLCCRFSRLSSIHYIYPIIIKKCSTRSNWIVSVYFLLLYTTKTQLYQMPSITAFNLYKSYTTINKSDPPDGNKHASTRDPLHKTPLQCWSCTRFVDKEDIHSTNAIDLNSQRNMVLFDCKYNFFVDLAM